MNELKKARLKAKKYKRLYDAEVKTRKDAELKIYYLDDLLKRTRKCHKKLVVENGYLESDKENLSLNLDKVNRLYLDTYNIMQEIDAKRAELVRENNLLHDTLASYKIPVYKKTWAEVKHGIKSWVRQFDEK